MARLSWVTLIQFSVDEWDCAPSLLFSLKPNYGRGISSNGDLLQKALGQHRCPRCPWPGQPTVAPRLCSRLLDTHSSSVLWVHCFFLLGPGVPSEHLWQVWGLILNVILPLLPSCWDFSFAVGYGVSFFGGVQHSPVDGCWAMSCSCGVLEVENECMSFYSAIFITL